MKRYIIKGAERVHVFERVEDFTKHVVAEGGEGMQVSDTYHEMDELYEHRHALWIALCGQIANDSAYRVVDLKDEGETVKGEPRVWRSKRHSDGELAFGGGWFVLGIGKEKGEQVTYHLPISKWDETGFAETLEKAPEFDGHSSKDVLERLRVL
jgi:hypothetical protein